MPGSGFCGIQGFRFCSGVSGFAFRVGGFAGFGSSPRCGNPT